MIERIDLTPRPPLRLRRGGVARPFTPLSTPPRFMERGVVRSGLIPPFHVVGEGARGWGKRPIAVLLITIILAAMAMRPAAAQTGSALTVHVDHVQGAISPLVYGGNYGPWDMLPPDTWAQAAAGGFSYLRFPAGSWGDQNDFQQLDVDLLSAFAQKINGVPAITVRLSGGTPAKAAEWVRYANITNKYNIRYWMIGNEPNLYDNYTVDQFNKDWRAMAQAMLAVDPTIILVGPETSQYPPPSITDPSSVAVRDWVRQFLKANGDLVKVVSVHRYPFPRNGTTPPTIDDLRKDPADWDTLVQDLRKTIRETVGHDLPIAITEANSTWAKDAGGPASPDSVYNAVWWADVLGHLIRQHVDIVAYWLLSGVGLNDGTGLIRESDVRPTYYTYVLYHQFGDQLVESTSSDSDVSITAATRKDGALTLMVVNRAATAKSVTVSLTGFTTAGTDLWRFDADHKGTKIGTSDELKAGTLNLPPASVSLYVAK